MPAAPQPARRQKPREIRITVLFILLALSVSALLNGGNFGTIDTARRWQVARWIRLGEPPVSPEDARQGFGIPGRYGVRHAWYGVGQSLLLLPFDALVDAAITPQLPRLGIDPVRRKQIDELILAFLMQAFLTACVLVLARHLLLGFAFGSFAATAGALALVFATTCLQYVQCAQENLLLLTLALAGLAAIRALDRDGRPRWALLAGMACGFAILTRLTSLLETGALVIFAIAAGSNAKRFLLWFTPPVAGARHCSTAGISGSALANCSAPTWSILGRLNRQASTLRPHTPFRIRSGKVFWGLSSRRTNPYCSSIPC